jgi:hypothetical protein
MGRSCHAYPVIIGSLIGRPVRELSCCQWTCVDDGHRSMPGLSWRGLFSGPEAAEGYRRVGGLILSRLFVGSLGAGARPPINLDCNG